MWFVSCTHPSHSINASSCELDRHTVILSSSCEFTELDKHISCYHHRVISTRIFVRCRLTHQHARLPRTWRGCSADISMMISSCSYHLVTLTDSFRRRDFCRHSDDFMVSSWDVDEHTSRYDRHARPLGSNTTDALLSVGHNPHHAIIISCYFKHIRLRQTLRSAIIIRVPSKVARFQDLLLNGTYAPPNDFGCPNQRVFADYWCKI